MRSDQRFQVSPRVANTLMDGGSVIIDKETGDCYELNRIGAAIWAWLEAGESVDRIIARLSAEHCLSEQEVQSDVEKLVADLLAHHLLIPA